MIGLGPTSVSPPSGFASLGTPSADQIIVENHAGTGAGWVTVAGDLTQTGGVFKVVAISGTSPIAITPNELQWVTGAAPKWSQIVAAVGVAPAAMSFACQLPNAGSTTAPTNTPGGYSFVLPAPGSNTVAGAEGGFVVNRAAVGDLFRVAQYSAGIVGVWVGSNSAVAPSTTNYFLKTDGASVVLGATSSGNIQFRFAEAGNSFYISATGVQIAGRTPSFGGGSGVAGITTAVTDPSTKPSGGGIVWERHDGSAIAHFGSGGAQCDMAPSGTGTVNTQAFVEILRKFVASTPLSMASTSLGSINLNAFRGKQVDLRLYYQLRDTTDPTGGGGPGGGMNSGEYRLLISNTAGVVAIQADLLLWQMSPTVASSGPTFDVSVTDVITFKGASPNANAWDWTLSISGLVN